MTRFSKLFGRPLVLAALAMGPVAAPAGWAQEAAQTGTISFDIPAQSLAGALAQYGRVTSYQVAADATLLRGRTAPALSGQMSAETALDRLLAGSGLTWRTAGEGHIVLFRPVSTDAAGTEGETLLDPITMTTARLAEAPYRTGSAASYISPDQIARRRGASPGDIFKGTPGVIASANHNGSQLDVNIRGMQGQNRTKVAIDGTQQTSTTWRGYIGVDERVYLDPDLIADIGVAKGPTDTAQGAGTTGGVVAVRTLTAKDIVPEGETQGWRLRFGAGDNAASAPHSTPQSPVYDQRDDAPGLTEADNLSGSLAYGYLGDNVDLFLAYARRKRGNYFAGTEGPTTYEFNGRDYPLSFTKPGEEVFNSSEDSSTLMAKATFYWQDGQALQLGYTDHRTKFGESMGSLLFMQDNGFRQVKLSDIEAKTYTARYRWQPGSDLIDLEANLWMTDVSGTTRAVGGALYFPPNILPADEPRYSKTLTYGVDVTNTSRLTAGVGELSLRYGISWLREDMDAEEYCSRSMTNTPCVRMSPSNGTRDVASVFSSGTWTAGNLSLSAGLRYDAWRLKDRNATDSADATRDGGRLNPSVGAMWEAVPGLQFFARYAEGVRPPTLRETMGSDANATPNPDLRAETAHTVELGANLLRKDLWLAEDTLGLKLVAFHNSYDDYVSRVPADPVPGQPVFTFDNLSRAEFTGLEFSGRYDSRRFFAEASATYYLDYEFCYTEGCQDTAVLYDYATNHLPPELMTSLTAGMRFLDERLTVGATIHHAGSRMAPLTTSDRQRTAVWRPYAVGDLFVDYDLNDRTRLSLSVENVTDRYYIDALDGWTPAPGRTLRLNLETTF
ncbi:TonB-dependent receptor [Celeribacter indicus]|uniref:Heme receptor n=1 Tax=Celeribacter indicus TaxID=1208324 RepID=A0A0B5E034_9RHOB|nr:TonB-dependent receptor [Celeribacter indicus]AJE45812.1 heme receptor [Celeribacter indicus]SDW61260.1 hemoglobin/transferrin/lactoferrin receptor protein [Celeribacter indicus]